MTPSKTLRASVNQYECSMATPRSNCACTLASQDVANVTLPSLSGWAGAGSGSAMTHRRANRTALILMGSSLSSAGSRRGRTRCHHRALVAMCPMHFCSYNRCVGCIERGPATLARFRDHRRRRRLRPRRRATEPQSTGAVAADPRPRDRAGRPALRPYRASDPAHGRGRRPAAASPRTVDGRRLARRAGAGPQRWAGRCAPGGRHTAGDGDPARRFPSALSPGAPRHRRAPRRGRRRSPGHTPRAERRSPRAHRLYRCAVPLALAGAPLRPGRVAEVAPAGPRRDAGDRRTGR